MFANDWHLYCDQVPSNELAATLFRLRFPAMSSSRLSDFEVEATLKDDDLEISFTAASQIPNLPHLPEPSRTRSLPAHKAMTGVFPGISLGRGSQSGTPAPQTTSATASETSTSANHVQSRHSPGVSSLESSTGRQLRNVAPAVVGELEKNTAPPVKFADFVNALSFHAPQTGNKTALLADNEKVRQLVQSYPKKVKTAWDVYVQSATKRDEKAQYQPFSELCKAITTYVSPSALEGAATFCTLRNDPKRLVCSRDDAMRSPDVITVS